MNEESQKGVHAIKKIQIKRQHLQVDHQSDNNNSHGDTNTSGGKIKLERIKGYGRWYLKPEQFTKLVKKKPLMTPQNEEIDQTLLEISE